MQAPKILFATDFSPASQTALEVACSLARSCHAELLIVHAFWMPPVAGDAAIVSEQYEASLKNATQQLTQVPVADRQLPVRRVLLKGAPIDEIVGLAQQEEVDLVVIGTHGRSGLTRLLMGSVAEAIVRRAGCPVITVRPGVRVPEVYSPVFDCLDRCEPLGSRGLSARVGGARLSAPNRQES